METDLRDFHPYATSGTVVIMSSKHVSATLDKVFLTI